MSSSTEQYNSWSIGIDSPLLPNAGGTGLSNPVGSTLSMPDGFPIVLHSDANGATHNTVAVNSATPGTVRAIAGDISNTATTMTAGNLVGVRGDVTVPAGQVVSGASFLYGVQGKMIVAGTLQASVWATAVFGQLDISAATLSGGQIACLWGDAGTTGPSATVADFNMVRLTNTTPTIAHSVLSSYGKATFVLDMELNGGVQFLAAGTASGSAGDTTKCNATKVLAIQVDGVSYWVPAFAQNT